MQLILIVLILGQVSGALSTDAPLQEQRGLMDIWDKLSPIAIPVALGIDTALSTISNAHGAVTNAVTQAIHGVTSWIGGALPALGKRSLEIDVRLSLLNELQSFRNGFHQLVLNIIQSFINGSLFTSASIKPQLQQLYSKLSQFMQTHLNSINNLIATLIPTMKDLAATQAITSCLHAIRVIEESIKKIHALFIKV
jgi:hypothetical protein